MSRRFQRAPEYEARVQTSLVKRGFPFLVKGRVCPAEPDVGYDSEYVDDLQVYTIKGGSTEWLKLSDSDLDILAEEFYEKIMEGGQSA